MTNPTGKEKDPHRPAYGPPERVHVENEWYDGPRSGIADVNGVPHRFRSLFDEGEDAHSETFLLWPIDEATLRLEVEQWHIFCDWFVLFETGQAGTELHPANGGIHPRWDELEALLKDSRADVPPHARKAHAELVAQDQEYRYGPDGPDYRLRWVLL